MREKFYIKGQSLVGIIIVLVVVGLISGGLYYYFSKQIPEIPEITEKPGEKVVKPEEKITPPVEKELPKEEKPTTSPEKEVASTPETTCQNGCSPAGSKRCSNNGYQICGNYDADVCLEWSSVTNCPSDTVCQNGNCQKLNEHCLRIVGSGKRGMDLFFVGSNYPLNNILYNNRYNLGDFNVNLENDVMRLLYSTEYNFGYGLLTIEPFASNLDRINVYLITEPFQYDWTQEYYYFETGKELVKKYCNTVYTPDDVIGIINADNNPLTYSVGGGIISISGSGHRRGHRDYKYVGVSFIHELGHAFGLWDNYAFGYQENGLMTNSTAVPNCDNTPGCPKWCSGLPKQPYKTICDNYNEQECKEHYDDQTCIWLPQKDPYFKRQCIKNDGAGFYEEGNVGEQNIGTECLVGTGCYFGCSHAGWRPEKENTYVSINSQKIDPSGKKHTFDPVSERFLGEIFECCYPQDCKNYNSAKCSDFAGKYSKYSSCSVCSQ